MNPIGALKAIPAWGMAVIFVLAIAGMIWLFGMFPGGLYGSVPWSECINAGGTTCAISQQYRTVVDEVYMRVPTHPEWGIPSAAPGDNCAVSYSDVWIYSPSVGGCPQNHPNCNPQSVIWSGTVGSDYICRVTGPYLLGCGGCTYQRYYNQPIIVSIVPNQQQCGAQPDKPCNEAVWLGYPSCQWDTSACAVIPPPEPPGIIEMIAGIFQAIFDWIRGLIPW